jgi:hypothetical protein
MALLFLFLFKEKMRWILLKVNLWIPLLFGLAAFGHGIVAFAPPNHNMPIRQRRRHPETIIRMQDAIRPSILRHPPLSSTTVTESSEPTVLLGGGEYHQDSVRTITIKPPLHSEIIHQPASHGVSKDDNHRFNQSSRAVPIVSWFRSWTRSIQQQIQSWSKKLRWHRPSVQFRVQLGLGAMAALALCRWWIPTTKVTTAIQHWVTHRGFQGIAALGRSVAYGWALLVGYPRMLDRRAHEKQRNERDKALERRRHQLRALAAEVARLRHEVATLDQEMRTFRREIISFKANGIVLDPDVQEAIGVEMAHLGQLLADTQAALVAVRQTWAELRSKSPPELWEDILDPTTIGGAWNTDS